MDAQWGFYDSRAPQGGSDEGINRSAAVAPRTGVDSGPDTGTCGLNVSVKGGQGRILMWAQFGQDGIRALLYASLLLAGTM